MLAKKQYVCQSANTHENEVIIKSSPPANDSNTNLLKQMYVREATEVSVYEISLPAGLLIQSFEAESCNSCTVQHCLFHTCYLEMDVLWKTYYFPRLQKINNIGLPET